MIEHFEGEMKDANMYLKDNLEKVRREIEDTAGDCGRNPDEIKLLVVSKGRDVEKMKYLQELGLREFGENRVEELLEKKKLFDGIDWHFIGRLRSKYAKKVAGETILIHSADSVKLLKRIDAAAEGKGAIQEVLLQVNTSGEESKQGFDPEQIFSELDTAGITELKSVKISGLMTMAPFTDDEVVIRECFKKLAKLKDKMNSEFNLGMTELSMGMTNDYRIAIEEGATILRIGSLVFEK